MSEDNVLMILKRRDIVSTLMSMKWDRDIGDNRILDSDSLLYTNQRESLRLHCKKIDGHPAIEYEYGHIYYKKTLFGFKVMPKSCYPWGGVSPLVNDLIKYVIDVLKITTEEKFISDLESLDSHYDIGTKKEVRYEKYLVLNITVEQFLLSMQKVFRELNCMLFEETKEFYLYVKEKEYHKKFVHYEDNPQNRKLLWPEISCYNVIYRSPSDAYSGIQRDYNSVGLINLRTYTEIFGLGFAIIEDIIKHDYKCNETLLEMMQHGKLGPIVYKSLYGKTIKFGVNGFEPNTNQISKLQEW